MTKITYYWLVGVIAMFVLLMLSSALLVPLPSSASSPSDCNNRIDAKIISMKANNGRKSTDLLKHHSIDAKIEKGYLVKVKLQTLSKYTGEGRPSLWVTNTAYGFSSGTCFENVKVARSAPSSTVTLIFRNVQMGQAVEGLIQPVIWGSFPNIEQVNYDVRWR